MNVDYTTLLCIIFVFILMGFTLEQVAIYSPEPRLEVDVAAEVIGLALRFAASFIWCSWELARRLA